MATTNGHTNGHANGHANGHTIGHTVSKKTLHPLDQLSADEVNVARQAVLDARKSAILFRECEAVPILPELFLPFCQSWSILTKIHRKYLHGRACQSRTCQVP